MKKTGRYSVFASSVQDPHSFEMSDLLPEVVASPRDFNPRPMHCQRPPGRAPSIWWSAGILLRGLGQSLKKSPCGISWLSHWGVATAVRHWPDFWCYLLRNTRETDSSTRPDKSFNVSTGLVRGDSSRMCLFESTGWSVSLLDAGLLHALQIEEAPYVH